MSSPESDRTICNTVPVWVMGSIFEPTVLQHMNAHHRADQKLSTDGLMKCSSIKNIKAEKYTIDNNNVRYATNSPEILFDVSARNTITRT